MSKPQYTIADFLESRAAMGPSFSASGAQIAFLANLTGTFQVYVAPLPPPALGNGGLNPALGDRAQRQVTDYPDQVSLAAFSPTDEDVLVFSKDEGGNERHQLYLLNLSTNTVDPLTDVPSAAHRFGGWSRDGKRIAYASYKRNGVDHDVYVLDLATMSETMVFDLGGWCECFGFSPSGRWLVVSKTKAGGFMDTELYLVNSSGNENAQLLTPHDEKACYSQAEWLPDESGFWMLSDDNDDFVSANRIDLGGGQPTVSEAVGGTDYGIEEIAISADGTTVAMMANIDGFSTVSLATIGSDERFLPTAQFPSGQHVGLTWSGTGQMLACSVSGPTSSFNVWMWDHNRWWASPITRMPMGVPEDVLVQPDLIQYSSFDGLEIPAFLYMPRESQTTPLPAVVYIHGGPEGQFRPAFNPIIQYFVYRGYAVIAPNVRGSDGYGKKYLALDDRFKRMDSVRDLAGLHAWIAADGRIDPKRVALMGGSYGGYMVLAGLAFLPDLWAAGVDIVGISNLVTFLGNTSSYRRSQREAEYGFLATDREFLESVSPTSKADQIRAPLMIIHGANDPRVPLSEAVAMRDSLAKRGIDTEMLVYDDEGHGLSKLKNRLDAYPRVAAFLDRVLR